MNKQGAMSDLFIFMILAIAVIFISAIFIYLGGKAYSEIKEKSVGLDAGGIAGNENVTKIVDKTIGAVDTAYQSLYWIALLLIIGMVVSIFIHSYLVTTKPVFFIPYIFLTIIAVIVAVGLSNAYEQVIADPTLASIFAGFVGANFIMLKLPIWITVIGIVGGIIMFIRMGSKDNQLYGGQYG